MTRIAEDIYWTEITKIWPELNTDHKKLLAELANKFCEYCKPLTRIQHAQKIMDSLGRTEGNGYKVVAVNDDTHFVEIVFEDGSSTKVSGRWAKELREL